MEENGNESSSNSQSPQPQVLIPVPESSHGNGYLNHSTVPPCTGLLTIPIPGVSGTGNTSNKRQFPGPDSDNSDPENPEEDLLNSSCSSFDDECPASPRKRRRMELDIGIQAKHLETQEIQRLGNAWKCGEDTGDGGGETGSQSPLSFVSHRPFTHCQIDNFLSPDETLYALIKATGSEVPFANKCSDLFQFRQSDDLKTVIDVPEVNKIRDLFEREVFELVERISGFPLSGRVDMFLSDYQEADHLLCHDDELEDRRIAFIFYLNSDWKPQYGGTLDLFHSNDEIQPTTIATSISPTYNRFVFFDVHSRSFHQVSEIREPGVSRLALSGWFYGEPRPRPELKLPQTSKYLLQQHRITNSAQNSTEYSIENTLEDVYSDTENQKVFNKQLEEESEAMLMEFFKPEILKDLLQEAGVGGENGNWRKEGPVNLCNYWTFPFQIPGTGVELETLSQNPLQKMVNFFHSMPFLQFLETILEMPFTSDAPIHVHSELRKFEHGNYTLLKSENSEIEQERKHRAIRKARRADALDVAVAASSNNRKYKEEENEGEEEDEEMENENEEEMEGEEEEDDEDEEGNLVDLIYYFGHFQDWDELNGGQTIYIDGNGDQVMSINPTPNSLAIIVRTKSVNSYVSYVNYMSQSTVFYAYTMTFQLTQTDILRPITPTTPTTPQI